MSTKNNTPKWRNTEATLKELEKVLKLNPYLMFFDTETTGLKPGRDKIIQMAGIKVDRDFNIISTFNELCNPEPVVIPQKITEITGISNSEVQNARCEKDVLLDFKKESAECTFFAYNSNFDANMYTKSLAAYGVDTEITHFDVLKLAKDVLCGEKLENFKLGTVAEFLSVVPEDKNFHNALFDVSMTIEVFKALLRILRNKGYVSSEGKKCPKIWALRSWDMGKNRRVYVATSAGTLYYDKIKQVWGDKDAGIENLNMDYIEHECIRIAHKAGFDKLSKIDKEIKAY